MRKVRFCIPVFVTWWWRAFPHFEDVFHRMWNHCRPDDAKGNKKILDKRYQTDSETAYSIASKVAYASMLVNGKSEQINIGH